MGGRPKVYHDLEGIASFKAVQNWMRNLREGHSRRVSIYSFARFLRWRKTHGHHSNPDALIEECLNGTSRTLVQHLQVLLEYCQGETLENESSATKQKHYRTIRSFYAANMVALPKTKLKSGRSAGGGNEVRYETTATEFLIMMSKALPAVKIRDRAIMLTALQSGMDDSTLASVFNYVGYPQLAKHFESEDSRLWDNGNCPVRVALVRPKSNYGYYSFLDVDAVETIKDWLNIRPGQIRTYPPRNPQSLPVSDPIFTTIFGTPIVPSLVNKFSELKGRGWV